MERKFGECNNCNDDAATFYCKPCKLRVCDHCQALVHDLCETVEMAATPGYHEDWCNVCEAVHGDNEPHRSIKA